MNDILGVILQNGNGGHSYHEDDHSVLMAPDSVTDHGHSHHHHEEDKKNGRHRPRKRKLYAEICKQMEFYFSDANITKNRMMREIVEQANAKSEGYVDLCSFLEFTKIQRLQASIHHIQKALRNSQKLELSPDELKARRLVAFDVSKVKSDDAVEECTIYVENIPRDADHEWLEKIFQAFGPVAYISLPKFKSGQHKSFGFVEFDDADAARRCLEAYGEEGACLSNNIDPSELRSIQSFNEEKETPENGKNNGTKGKKKRKVEESLVKDEDEPKAKKGKGKDEEEESSSSEAEEVEKKPIKEVDDDEGEVGTSTSLLSKKSKKKRKKTKAKKSGEVKLESESIMLKVLPKKSWRQLRNRYLNLQRNNMAKLKKQLQKEHVRAQHFKNFYQPPQQHQNEHEQRGQSQNFDNREQSHYADEEYGEKKGLDHIMEIKLRQPVESTENFKHQITVELAEQDEDEALISGFIKFVDYKDNDCQAYVRINADESFSARADNLLKKAKDAFVSARFLTGKNITQ